MKNIYSKLLVLALMGAPLFVHAKGVANNVESMLSFVQKTIGMLIPIVIGIAVLTFLWGIVKYVVAKEEEAQKEARSIILYGTIVLFVMVSIWGLVNLLDDTLGLSNEVPKGPGIPSTIQK